MTKDEVQALVGGIGPVIKAYVTSELYKLHERIAELETHFGKALEPQAPAELELSFDGERLFTVAHGRIAKSFKVPVPLYRGVWQPAEQYEVGDMVTFGGSMWSCTADTNSRPATEEGSQFWKLCVKRGRDGRDGKDKAA
jgi:hypothetical protein